MTRLMHLQGIAALTVAIALAPGAASAQEADTVTISGTFSMDYLSGTVGPDLAEIYANGHEHTWTLTLYGTTQSHHTYSDFGMSYVTEIHATSFDLEFFGPDGATLNGIVSDHLAGGDVLIELRNVYSTGFGDDFALWSVAVGGPDVWFWTGLLSYASDVLFPSDEDGFPVVGPDPFSIWSEGAFLSDYRPGNDGRIESWDEIVTLEGNVGEPEPEEPVVLAVADASLLEGNRGSSTVAVAVTLSRSSNAEVTVRYATANGTALAKSDYSASSGTLTFRPGETRRTISVSITGDRKREPNEAFTVQLPNAVGATIADGAATVTILNDD